MRTGVEGGCNRPQSVLALTSLIISSSFDVGALVYLLLIGKLTHLVVAHPRVVVTLREICVVPEQIVIMEAAQLRMHGSALAGPKLDFRGRICLEERVLKVVVTALYVGRVLLLIVVQKL